MTRRFVGMIASSAFAMIAMAPAANAQPSTNVFRIGHLHSLYPTPFHDTFWQRLRDLGFVEGRNLIAERRYAKGNDELLPVLAAELVRVNVDVIFTSTVGATQSAKAATRHIPIVAFDLETDPVGSGLIESIARPGGNLTGVFLDLSELRGKQLALLQDVVPGFARAAVLWDPSTHRDPLRATEAAAKSLGIELRTIEVRVLDDLDRAFVAANAADVQALLVLSSPLFYLHRERITEYAAKRRLPAITQFREFADAGGLLAYGPNLHELFRVCASLTARILRGAKPADLPAERPVRYELVINLKTAKALGIAIPPRLLVAADEVLR